MEALRLNRLNEYGRRIADGEGLTELQLEDYRNLQAELVRVQSKFY